MKRKIEGVVDKSEWCQTPCPYGEIPFVGSYACQKCRYNKGNTFTEKSVTVLCSHKKQGKKPC